MCNIVLVANGDSVNLHLRFIISSIKIVIQL